jgi:formylmethanofuran dehydrogenase subunit E
MCELPDYTELHDRYERQQHAELLKYPKCSCCEEPITDEHFYLIKGDKICPACLDGNYKQWTDDYIE